MDGNATIEIALTHPEFAAQHAIKKKHVFINYINAITNISNLSYLVFVFSILYDF